jgi:hypothetical protein
VLFVLGGAIVVVVLFLVFRSSDDKSSTVATTTSTTTPTSTTAVPPSRVLIAIRVAKARPVGGIRHAEVKQGKKVSLVVTSPDTTDEVHLHGYDLHSDIEDGRAQIDFTATIAGRFEAELEDHGVQILDLEVTP